MLNTEELWDAIIEEGIATEEELHLVTDINGYNNDTLNDVIYARTGYRDMEQYEDLDEEDEDLEDEDLEEAHKTCFKNCVSSEQNPFNQKVYEKLQAMTTDQKIDYLKRYHNMITKYIDFDDILDIDITLYTIFYQETIFEDTEK